jgi:hypothetical protein
MQGRLELRMTAEEYQMKSKMTLEWQTCWAEENKLRGSNLISLEHEITTAIDKDVYKKTVDVLY